MHTEKYRSKSLKDNEVNAKTSLSILGNDSGSHRMTLCLCKGCNGVYGKKALNKAEWLSQALGRFLEQSRKEHAGLLFGKNLSSHLLLFLS